MGTHGGTVDEDFLEVGVFTQDRKDVVPDILVSPAGKANIGAVPGAKLCRKVTPGASRSRDPQDSFDEEAVINTSTPSVAFLAGQQLLDAYPLIIPQYHSQHLRSAQR